MSGGTGLLRPSSFAAWLGIPGIVQPNRWQPNLQSLLHPSEPALSFICTLNSKDDYRFENSKENLAYRMYQENAKPL
jgi:hypothetical protein